jgi:transposase
MEKWCEIRQRVKNQGVSKRQILRETGMHWKTLEKILENPQPPGYRQKESRPKPKIGPYLNRIHEILKEDRDYPKKQRHTAKRIFERIQEEGYEGGYTMVQEAVRELKDTNQEVYIPLSQRPGEAQVDFGYALVHMNGILRKVAFFVMALPFSDALFVAAFERECTETFWEGHVRAFEFFGGVPTRITYDNSKVMVSKILGVHKRKLTDGFLQLKSHYLFDHHFCTVRRANEKGIVEGCVKFARLNFFVPVPRVRSFKELNSHLEACCISDRNRKVWGKSQTKKVLLEEEQKHFLQLPASSFDACRKVSTAANSLSLVRFDRNDYSVPAVYAHRPVIAKGYVNQVVLFHKDQEIARHDRVWDKETVTFNPVHYLQVLEEKPGALDYARPLEDWNLPDCFDVLRRRLETEQDHQGTREFIRVLRLLEHHSLQRLSRAVEKALRVRGHSRDAVGQFLYDPEYDLPRNFSLNGRDHLKQVHVQSPDIGQYNTLLAGGGQ